MPTLRDRRRGLALPTRQRRTWSCSRHPDRRAPSPPDSVRAPAVRWRRCRLRRGHHNRPVRRACRSRGMSRASPNHPEPRWRSTSRCRSRLPRQPRPEARRRTHPAHRLRCARRPVRSGLRRISTTAPGLTRATIDEPLGCIVRPTVRARASAVRIILISAGTSRVRVR